MSASEEAIVMIQTALGDSGIRVLTCLSTKEN